MEGLDIKIHLVINLQSIHRLYNWRIIVGCVLIEFDVQPWGDKPVEENILLVAV